MRPYISNAAGLARCGHTASGLRRTGWRRRALFRCRLAKTRGPRQHCRIVFQRRVEWMVLHPLCRRCRCGRHHSVVPITLAGKVAAYAAAQWHVPALSGRWGIAWHNPSRPTSAPRSNTAAGRVGGSVRCAEGELRRPHQLRAICPTRLQVRAFVGG